MYLAHPAVWYTAEGGINALDLLPNLEKSESKNINRKNGGRLYFGRPPFFLKYKNYFLSFGSFDCLCCGLERSLSFASTVPSATPSVLSGRNKILMVIKINFKSSTRE